MHLWLFWGLAVVQPLFDLLSRNATFVLFHRGGTLEIWLLVILLALLPLAVFYLWERLSRRVSASASQGARWVFIAVLASLAVLPLIKRLDSVPATLQLPLAALAALVLIAAYVRWRRFRQALTMAAPVVLIFAVGLLTSAEVRGLAAPRGDGSAVEAPKGSVPVVMVVFDGLPLATLLDRQLNIDRELFPNFARLADRAHWLRNASTVSSHTVGAIPALLTGNSPRHGAAPTLAHYPDNLFTLLDGRYRIAAREPISRLSPVAESKGSRWPRWSALAADLVIVYRHIVTPELWLDRLPPVDQTWGGFAELQPLVPKSGPVQDAEGRFALSDSRGAAFEAFIESLTAGGGDRLYFQHVVLPHFPWRYLPSGRVYGVGHSISAASRSAGDVGGTWWVDGESLPGRLYMRHIVQTQYADRLLGRLLDRLEALELLDRALLIVTSDHGDSFWSDGTSRVKLLSLSHPDDVLRVPLWVKLPGQTAGRLDDRNVDLRDVTPAIADALGVRIPWEVDGHSPFADDFPTRRDKRLADRAGNELSFGGVFEPDLETQDYKNGLFPPEESFRRLQRFGPMPELIGRSLDELETTPAEIEAEVAQATLLADLDSTSRLWPVRLSGSLRLADPPAEMILALAVNGRIEATTRLKFRQDLSFFSVFVAEAALHGGANSLDIVLIESDAAKPWLRVVPGSLGSLGSPD